MIVTIDGPAGAGKSSVSRRLADALGFRFLDTGAMYRAIALKGLRHQVDWHDEHKLANLAEHTELEMHGDSVLMDGEDVSEAIRTVMVTQVTCYSANNIDVRRRLVELQREIAAGQDMVCEGRDQGTVVFPNADCKIFLTASPEERARRRCNELIAKGQPVQLQQIYEQQVKRDREDEQRKIGGLRKAEDAVELVTDGLSEEEVLSQLVAIVQRCQHA